MIIDDAELIVYVIDPSSPKSFLSPAFPVFLIFSKNFRDITWGTFTGDLMGFPYQTKNSLKVAITLQSMICIVHLTLRALDYYYSIH